MLALLIAGGAMVSACSSSTVSPASSQQPLPSGRLRPVAHLPRFAEQLHADGALALPVGWEVDGYGVRRDGHHLVFGAERVGSARTAPNHVPIEQTWVVDDRTGKLWAYRLVNRGWYGGPAVAASGWMLRTEVAQTDGGFLWRAYAQKLPSGRPKLIAKNTGPANQTTSPIIQTDGHSFAWEQGNPDGSWSVCTWTPTAGLKVIARRPRSAIVSLVDGKLYLIERRGNGDPVYRQRLLRLSLTTGRIDGRPITYRATSIGGVGPDRLAYFPSPQWQGPWRVRRLSGAPRSVRLLPAINSPYAVDWVDSRRFVSWSESGITLYDVARGRAVLKIAPSTPRYTAPRTDGGVLTLGYSPASGAMIVWKRIKS